MYKHNLYHVLDFKVLLTNFEFLTFFSWSWQWCRKRRQITNLFWTTFKDIWIFAPFTTSLTTSAVVQNSNAVGKQLVRHTLILKSVRESLKIVEDILPKSQQPIKGISFRGNIVGAIINFIQYYTPITTFALQSSHPLVFQAAWEVIKIKLQPCTLQPWFMAITHEVYKKKDKNCSKGEFF